MMSVLAGMAAAVELDAPFGGLEMQDESRLD
jgi:hypothetical protein